MTIVKGHKVTASPCCRTSYRIPQYSSINLSAYGYWTDGEKESGLYPVGDGLRKCQCGSYYLLRDAISVDCPDASGVPNAQWVRPADLPEAIRTASSAIVDLADFSNVGRWYSSMMTRPAVIRGDLPFRCARQI